MLRFAGPVRSIHLEALDCFGSGVLTGVVVKVGVHVVFGASLSFMVFCNMFLG